MEDQPLLAVLTLLLSLLACSVYSVKLSPSGNVSLCEGEMFTLLCGEADMAVRWNVTGIQKYSNSTSLLIGPVSSMDNGATVQCEADGQKSGTAHILVGPPSCAIDVHSTFVPTNRSLFIWWSMHQCDLVSSTAFVVEWSYPGGFRTSGNISSAMYLIPNVEPLKEYAVTVSLINKCGRGSSSRTITFGSPLAVSIFLGVVLIVFLSLAMILSITPACYRNIKANCKDKGDQYERLEDQTLLESIELKVPATKSNTQNGAEELLESIADAEAEASTSL